MPPALAVDWSRVLRGLGWQLVSLLVATVVVAGVEQWLGLTDASAIYLPAVAWVALRAGSWAAAGTAIGAFLLYNFLFVAPQFTLRVASTQEIVSLLLLLGIGIVIGQLAGAARNRASQALRSEREARASAEIARDLGQARRVRDVLPRVLERLAAETHAGRAWLTLGDATRADQLAGDSGSGALPPVRTHAVLRRTEGRAAAWAKISAPAPGQEHQPPARAPDGPSPSLAFRIPIERSGDAIGSLWLVRPGRIGPPSVEETRLLATTADLIGQAVDRDRLSSQAVELEVARRGDELKSAMLDSVSHDLRTPLAAIRAAAGNLSDPAIAWTDDARTEAARGIDAQAAHLADLVGSLLDMSRIRGGALHPQVELVPVDELVAAALGRIPALGARPVRTEIPGDLPPLAVDPLLMGQVLGNLLDNVALHTPSDAAVLVAAHAVGTGRVRIRVEDGGPGISEAALPRLLDRRLGSGGRAGAGLGLGLAIVRGLVDAMDGRLELGSSALGGLRVEIDLPAGERVEP